MEIIKIEWAGQIVLTTEQLAKAYKVNSQSIQKNFANAKEYFEPEKHYFRLEGGELRHFKSRAKELRLPISPFASILYLWTYQGAAHHCKMINTPEAWTIFNELERVYFAVKDADRIKPVEQPLLPLEMPTIAQNELALLRKENDALKRQLPAPKTLDFAVVYCLLMSNGTVKIGMTTNLTERTRALKKDFKLDVLDYYSTGFMSREEAAALEEKLKEQFADCSLGNEFYDVRFADVREIISTARQLA